MLIEANSALDPQSISSQRRSLITRIGAMCSAGQSFGKIADKLNAEGVQTKRGSAWRASTIKQISDRSA